MNFRTFVARIGATHGEHTFTLTRLLVAKTEASAHELATSLLYFLYGEPEDAEEGEHSVLVCNGEIALSVHSVREIGLATFLDMRAVGLVAYAEDGLKIPDEEALGDVKDFSSAIHKALSAKKVDVSNSQVLNAVASALGSRNWSQYKATVVSRADLNDLLAQCREVQSTRDNEGCDAPWTVADGSAIDKMVEIVARIEKQNAPASKPNAEKHESGVELRTLNPQESLNFIQSIAPKLFAQKLSNAVSNLSLDWRLAYNLTLDEISLECLKGGLVGLLTRATANVKVTVDANAIERFVEGWNSQGARLPDEVLEGLKVRTKELMANVLAGGLSVSDAEIRANLVKHNQFVSGQYEACTSNEVRRQFSGLFSLVDISVLP